MPVYDVVVLVTDRDFEPEDLESRPERGEVLLVLSVGIPLLAAKTMVTEYNKQERNKRCNLWAIVANHRAYTRGNVIKEKV